ncbi:ethyl tert-butyl ether degradation protein EthD [Candidatus Symbiopectobacterium sp. 'North America']|uniref:EthD domain-containing protein n=1 Tax=Candidatus Symbiopectobacterium sp. 'North America' TaxID=2794574 RepID=UPI0018C93820|nr:EthD domain-containing protein [Candidatus Symbiopectobacterium sp. 'North America']MBG6244030.1 ethyl tert-butyl ether degradation protein EthD [Candidatus Symbiopectobacterium sp. 'North America']
MLKLIMCVKRHPRLTREEFDHYLRNNHASLVSKHAALLGIRRYIQTLPFVDTAAQHALQRTRNADTVDFDGCAELWWDDMESHLAARKTEKGLRALQELIEDESKFVDLAHSQLWYGEERWVIAG